MNIGRNVLIWLVILVVGLVVLQGLFGNSLTSSSSKVAISQFEELVDQGQVREVVIEGSTATGTTAAGRRFAAEIPPGGMELFLSKLDDAGTTYEYSPPSGFAFGQLFAYLLPILLLVGFWFFMMRQMQGRGGGGMGFGRSKAKLLTQDMHRATFADVAGVEEAKADVEEIVDFLRDPQKFQRLGGKIPKGVLMVGPPGTGKTLLAKAIAGEANVPFFTISGSDFVEMFVGVGASRVRDMFEQARKNAPCIIFIDEIDAVGRARSMGMSGGHEEREQTLNQLLVEMDGFEANEGIILIAATNRADILDKALLRPGRFDRQVQVNLPDSIGREKILGIHSKNVPLGPDVDLARIAKGTPTFSGADLANLVNEAALLAARANKRVVTQEDFENAKDKVTMGPERRSAVRTEEEIELVAYHEGGHALVGVNVPLRDKLNKVTIIPRGGAGGYAQFLPENDAAMLKRKEQWKAELAMAYGGRIAEELIYGVDHVTAGAISDIQMATQQARVMVERLGFSERLGLRAFGPDQSEGMFGSMTKNYSDDYAKIIDEEVEQILKTAETTAREIISDNLEGLQRLKEALIEYETLSREEVEAVLRGETLERESRRVEPTRHADSSEAETPAPKPAPKPASGTSALPGIGGPAADS